MHWRSLHARSAEPGEPPDRRDSAGPTWRAASQWYGDLLGLLFFIFLLAGAANKALAVATLFRKLTVFLVATVPVLVAARPGEGDRSAAEGHRRVVGGTRWAPVLHLAVHIARGGARVGARPVRQEGRVPAYPEDQRADQVVGGAPGQLGRDPRSALFGFAGIVGALTKATQLTARCSQACSCDSRRSAWPPRPSTARAARGAALPAGLRTQQLPEGGRDQHWFAAGVATGGAVAVLGVAIAAISPCCSPSPGGAGHQPRRSGPGQQLGCRQPVPARRLSCPRPRLPRRPRPPRQPPPPPPHPTPQVLAPLPPRPLPAPPFRHDFRRPMITTSDRSRGGRSRQPFTRAARSR